VPRLARETGEQHRILAGHTLHFAVDAATREEQRLGGETGDVEAGGGAAFGEGGEIDPGSDVLQSRVEERIRMRALPEVTQQGAVMALRQVVMSPRQPIVGPQHSAVAQRLGDAVRPGT
jgi:hypothetical protein